jgi:hypothetical protein
MNRLRETASLSWSSQQDLLAEQRHVSPQVEHGRSTVRTFARYWSSAPADPDDGG